VEDRAEENCGSIRTERPSGEVATVTSKKAQRGPLLSSVFMVMLATAATGLLVIVGFQALPESVIPSTFGGEDREARNVQVTESPTDAPASVRPTSGPGSSAPTVAPSQAAERTEDARTPGPVSTSTTSVGNPGSGPTATKAPTKAPATTAPPRKTTSPSPTVKPTTPAPTSTTQAPSPAPTCGTGRKPRCPRSAEPAATPTSYSTSGYQSYDSSSDAPSPSGTTSTRDDRGHARKRAGR
jgi:hypothetical protein